MTDKSTYCHSILKVYLMLVDYQGHVDRVNVPGPVERETFKQWKGRVLGDGASDVSVFIPSTPAPNTRVSTLQSASSQHLSQVLKAQLKQGNIKKNRAIQRTRDHLAHSLSTLPKWTLNDILTEAEFVLEPSVKEFFERFTSHTADDIEFEDLLRDLVNAYNNSVRLGRKNLPAQPSGDA